MTASDDVGDIQFGSPATYRIVVQGVVSQTWSDRLAGMSIHTFDRGERPPHTTLEGPIRDQAQLSGVLDTLYGLHLPIIRVEEIGSED